MEFHVHTNASLLAMGTLLTHNIIGKSDQLLMYVYRLFNDVEQNYSTTKKKNLSYGLHIA